MITFNHLKWNPSKFHQNYLWIFEIFVEARANPNHVEHRSNPFAHPWPFLTSFDLQFRDQTFVWAITTSKKLDATDKLVQWPVLTRAKLLWNLPKIWMLISVIILSNHFHSILVDSSARVPLNSVLMTIICLPWSPEHSLVARVFAELKNLTRTPYSWLYLKYYSTVTARWDVVNRGFQLFSEYGTKCYVRI